MKTLKGQYIWIVGASSGIGAALAKELASRGAIVALSARREDKLEALCKSLDGTGHCIAPLDVSAPGTITKAQKVILKTFPRIDSALFMAAAYKPHDGELPELGALHKMLDINLGGAFNLIDTILPQFEKQGQGQLVLCASVAGYRGLPTGQPYCATKAALISLAESMKVDFEPKNIDIKVICPGFVKTPLTDKNDFTMPMIIEADEAARAIANGLISKAFEIHFPKKFTYIMKLIHILPNRLYFALARRMIARTRKKS